MGRLHIVRAVAGRVRAVAGRAAGLALLGLLMACGGSGGNDGPPVDPGPPINFAGRWSLTDNFEVFRSYSGACPEGEGRLTLTLTVTQDDEGKLVISTPYGPFEGQVTGSQVFWSGLFLDHSRNRWVAVRDVVMTFQASENTPDTAIGTGYFDHYEADGASDEGRGGLLCSGESHLTAVRTLE